LYRKTATIYVHIIQHPIFILGMKKYYYQLLISLTFIFLNFQAQAENTLGGTLDFTHKGGNNFNVKATIYVDKAAKSTSPDLYQGFIRASIFSKGANAGADVLVETVKINFLSREDDFPYENQACASSVPISTSKIVYSTDITLNKSTYNNANGYYLVCQDGNRNTTTNANTPFIGMTLYLEFPALNTKDNSSPVFNLKKGTVACLNQPFTIDLSASDADAVDTRTYRLVDPYSGPGYSSVAGKQVNQPISRNSFANSYILVPFLAGFSATNPITGTGITLNPSTGIMTGTPTQIGKFLVCIECKEFRGGVQIGLNRQDFEIIVDNCVNPKPKIYLSGNDPTIHEISAVICDGSFRILETVNNANFTYVWKKDNVVVSGANKYQIKVLYADAGKYTVTVTRTGACAGTETSLETELRPQAGENVRLTVADSTICSDAVPVILTIEQNSTGAALNNFRKQWYINNVLIVPNVFSQSHPVSVSGKYKVVVTDFSATGGKCAYEAFKEIIVTPVPNPTITNVTGKTSVCQGEIVKLRVTPVEADVTYHWVRNSADIATTTDLDVNSTGTYELRAESTVNTDCFAYAPLAINIAVNPFPTVTFDDIKPVCALKSAKIDLRNLVSPYDPALGVFTGTGVSGYEFDPTVSGYGSFPIKYTYTTLVGCGKDASKTAVVDLTPTVKLGNDLTIFRGDTVRLKSVGSTGNKYLYEWTPATSLNSPNIPQPIAKPDVTTEYVVKVSSVLGKCTATDKIVITVKSILKIPSAFTPNSDTINDTWAILDNNREFNDYPDIEVKIFNRWGGEIFYSIGSGAYQTKPFDGIQDGQRLPAGTYFYVIKPSSDVPSLTGYVTIVR
jgi:gliding motility-associated-like protein